MYVFDLLHQVFGGNAGSRRVSTAEDECSFSHEDTHIPLCKGIWTFAGCVVCDIYERRLLNPAREDSGAASVAKMGHQRQSPQVFLFASLYEQLVALRKR